MRDLADHTSGQPLAEVADMLGGRYAPFQLESVMRGEALRDGWLTWFARDMLVRSIHAICPAGWSSAETAEFTKIRALVDWCSAVEPIMGKEAASQAGDRLQAEAPPGWEPSGANDPLIARIVQVGFLPALRVQGYSGWLYQRGECCTIWGYAHDSE
jgi:hypothetical protein